jgi:hypothetical protein
VRRREINDAGDFERLAGHQHVGDIAAGDQAAHAVGEDDDLGVVGKLMIDHRFQFACDVAEVRRVAER